MTSYRLGAINKITKEYVYPKIANKKDDYICPECDKDLIFCKGKTRRHHFRHKHDDDVPCNYYDSPNEGQIHKDAKMILETLLERKVALSFIRKCCECDKKDEYEIQEITETSRIELEYNFSHNEKKYIADVAYIDENEIVNLFEICNTHRTNSQDRPEPWFELDAKELVSSTNKLEKNSLQIECIRCEKCEECSKKEKSKTDKKNRAVSRLYEWLEDGEEIQPFVNCYESAVPSIGLNERYQSGTDEPIYDYDLIIYYSEPEFTYDRCEKYLVNLTYNGDCETYNNCSQGMKTKYKTLNEDCCIVHIDIEWILAQSTKPNKIKYIIKWELDTFFNEHPHRKRCCECRSKTTCTYLTQQTGKNDKRFVLCLDCDTWRDYETGSISAAQRWLGGSETAWDRAQARCGWS